MFSNKTRVLIYGGFVIVTLLVVLAVFFAGKKGQNAQAPGISPTQAPYSPREIIDQITPPPSTLRIPTLPESSGGGVNQNAESVQTSINEIRKLLPYLPFDRTYTLSSGNQVEIIISTQGLETRPWVLPVFIGGIDYTVTPGSPGYGREKLDFLESVGLLNEWMFSHAVNPKAIYTNWGDQAYIQDRAEGWLESK